jgi:outer membrane protein assembly factor BamE (lipoprotein component of BamABCDE complex)
MRSQQSPDSSGLDVGRLLAIHRSSTFKAPPPTNPFIIQEGCLRDPIKIQKSKFKITPTLPLPVKKCLLLILLGIILSLLEGCVSKHSEMGVRNYWRDPSPPAFTKGKSTQADVMHALGPPSQVIALQDQTLFYYLREQSRTKAMFLIFYNHTGQEITYDRAIFFFNKQSVLTDFAYSAETVPLEK